MRRRLLVLFAVALLASSCDYREILRIRPDGSALIRLELDVERADHDDGYFPFLEWEAATELEEELVDSEDDTSARRRFFIELFALEGTEAYLDEAAEGFVLDVDETRLHMSVELVLDDLTSLSGDEFFEGSLLLTGAVVERGDDGTMSFSAPARATAAGFVGDYFAVDNDPFVEMPATSDAALLPITLSAEIDVPGDLLHSDSHERDGNTLEWSWESGRAGEPGIDVGWDPDAGDDGCELCSAFMPFVILILVLFGILGLGFIAATLGLFEAVRVTRRDRRDRS